MASDVDTDTDGEVEINPEGRTRMLDSAFDRAVTPGGLCTAVQNLYRGRAVPDRAEYDTVMAKLRGRLSSRGVSDGEAAERAAVRSLIPKLGRKSVDAVWALFMAVDFEGEDEIDDEERDAAEEALDDGDDQPDEGRSRSGGTDPLRGVLERGIGLQSPARRSTDRDSSAGSRNSKKRRNDKKRLKNKKRKEKGQGGRVGDALLRAYADADSSDEAGSTSGSDSSSLSSDGSAHGLDTLLKGLLKIRRGEAARDGSGLKRLIRTRKEDREMALQLKKRDHVGSETMKELQRRYHHAENAATRRALVDRPARVPKHRASAVTKNLELLQWLGYLMDLMDDEWDIDVFESDFAEVVVRKYLEVEAILLSDKGQSEAEDDARFVRVSPSSLSGPTRLYQSAHRARRLEGRANGKSKPQSGDKTGAGE